MGRSYIWSIFSFNGESARDLQMHKIDAEEDCVLLDDRVIRANAMITTFMLFLALVSPRPLVIVVLITQILVFTISILNPSKNPYSRISKRLSLVRLFKQGHGEHPKPVRFSQEVGLLFVLPALVLMVLGATIVPLVLLLACLLASSLNAFAGICIACRLYPRLTLLKHRAQQLRFKYI